MPSQSEPFGKSQGEWRELKWPELSLRAETVEPFRTFLGT